MQSAFINFKQSRVHYSYFGGGSTVLLCLHGYGESEQSFHFLEKYLPTQFSIVAIDFPFHGKTEWKEAEPITTEDLVIMLEKISDVHQLNFTSFQLLGFSM